MSSIDQQFVEYIVKSLVSSPESVIVERRIDEKGVLLELTVDPEDLGRVIGKRGATAQSLRTLLRALGTKNDARYNLKIVDNGTGASDTNGSADDSSVATDAPVVTSARSDQSDQDESEETVILDRKNDQLASSSTEDSDSDDSRVSKARRELQELDDLDV